MEAILRPARLVSPGAILRKELASRGWTQRELARRLKKPVQAINEIVNGGKQVTPQTAIALSRVMGTSLEFWWNLETNYRFRRALGSKANVTGRATERSSPTSAHAAAH